MKCSLIDSFFDEFLVLFFRGARKVYLPSLLM